MTDSIDTSEREAEEPRGPFNLPIREMRAEPVPHQPADPLRAALQLALEATPEQLPTALGALAAQPAVAAAMARGAVPHITPAQAMDALKEAFVADPSYAWTWHCGVWAAAHDEGMETSAANRAAARLMSMAFDVDTSKHENFAATQAAAPTPEATQPTQAEAPSEREAFGLSEIDDLMELHKRTSEGVWGKGASSHNTVAKREGQPDYRIADFHHADDASFVDAAHKFMPKLVALARTALATHPEQAANREDDYKAGWIQAAKWADRTDLISDIGSPAYERDRRAALARGEKT